MKPLIINNIFKSFKQGDDYLMVIKGANFSLDSGDLVGLVGPSGAGKTTLLEIVGLLNKPDSGDIFVKGTNVAKVSDEQRTKIRGQHIGFIYQFHHLLGEFTALENVTLQGLINGLSKNESTARAKEILSILKLSHRFHHLPSALSGGEQQRVAIARALVKYPSLILADEPTGNLDPHNADLVLELFLSVVKQLQIAALIVTHNTLLATKMDKIITLDDGKISHL